MVSQSRQNSGTLNAVKAAFLDCFSTSTGHGLPQIAKPGNRFLRVMWALLFDNGAPLDNIMFAFSGTTGSGRLYIRNSRKYKKRENTRKYKKIRLNQPIGLHLN